MSIKGSNRVIGAYKTVASKARVLMINVEMFYLEGDWPS
jgi:hypothetical protein